MQFDEFIQKYDGRGIDYDAAYGNQCMDLFHFFELFVLEQPANELLRAGTAYEAYLKGHVEFDKYDYQPGNVPEYGDVMFWDTSVGPAGHVAIFIEGSETSFKSFDQNWPVGSDCHIQYHTYNGVAGWLRFKQFKDLNINMDEVKKLLAELEERMKQYVDEKVKHRLSKAQAKQQYKPKKSKKRK